MSRIQGHLTIQVGDNEPVKDSIQIDMDDPFVAGVRVVDWLRGHADSLEKSMAKDAGRDELP